MSEKPRKRVVTWANAQEKAKWLDAAASLDAVTGEKTRRMALRFARAAGPNDPERFANAAFYFVRDSIEYVPDANEEEEFADSDTVLERGADDCDGKSRLFVALVRAAPIGGVEARILPVFRHHKGIFTPDDFVHVQAQVRWPGSEKKIHAGAGGWLRAELTLAGAELGGDPDALARLPGGARKLA